jgi:hypothetical protein
MLRLNVPLAVVVLCGCVPAGDVADQPPVSTPASSPEKDESAETPLPTSAFHYDQMRHVVTLDTRVAPPQRRRIDIGQGSITLETVSAQDGELTFRYTPEVEGGYTTYECTVPISPEPLEIKVHPGGTPGEASFDLKACKVVGQGNLHFDRE